MENLEERNDYIDIITTALINIKTGTEAVENLENEMQEKRSLIGAIYSKKKVEGFHVNAMEKIQNELSIIHIKLEILKNKVIKDSKVVESFKQFNDFDNKYNMAKLVLLAQIKKSQHINESLQAKVKSFIIENETYVAVGK